VTLLKANLHGRFLIFALDQTGLDRPKTVERFGVGNVGVQPATRSSDAEGVPQHSGGIVNLMKETADDNAVD
jgi:hypothetical protein